eukprot:6203727-Pleurochrysis_carterae.AAC.2
MRDVDSVNAHSGSSVRHINYMHLSYTHIAELIMYHSMLSRFSNEKTGLQSALKQHALLGRE